MIYATESLQESTRLNLQNQIPAYDYRRELADLEVPAGARVLDVGCASGEITNYLAQKFPHASFVGTDFSRERISEAPALSNCSFVCADACKLPFKNESFDLVLARALYQHLEGPQQTTEEIRRVLVGQGNVRIIDSYHLMLGLETEDPQLNRQIKLLKDNGICDFDVALKIPGFLTRAGFEVTGHARILWDFDNPKHRSLEVENNCRRFEQSMSHLIQLYGSEHKACKFVHDYLEACRDMGNRYWFEKHIIMGIKH